MSFLNLVAGLSLLPALANASVTVNQVTPSAASLSGDTLITIAGNGFREDCTVKLGNSSCGDVRLVNGSTLVCRTPAEEKAGTVQLAVNCPNENTNALIPFTYYAPLMISTPRVAESNVEFLLEINGGLPPYKVYWNQLSNYPDQQTSDPMFKMMTTYVGSNLLIVQDAAGNQTDQQVSIAPELGGGLHYLQPAFAPHSTIQIGSLGGSNTSDLKLVHGDAVLQKTPQGGYTLTFGDGGQTIEVSAQDDFTTLDLNFWVAASGYSDSTLSISDNDADATPLTMAFGPDEIYSVRKTQKNNQRVQVNSLSDGHLSWSAGDDNYGEKNAVTISTISPAGDRSLFVGGYAYHEGVFSSYDYAFLRKLTPTGATDKAFAPKLDFPHDSSILKMLARNDGGAWGVVDVFPPKGNYRHTRYLILWDAHGQETKRITVDQSTGSSGAEIQIASDHQEGLYLLENDGSGTKFITSILHIDRNGNSDSAFESATEKSLAGVQAPALSNFEMSKEHLYFVSQTGTPYGGLKWTGAMKTNSGNLTVLNLDGSLSSTLSKTNVTTAIFDLQNRLVTESSGTIKRFLPDGTVDTSYGLQGSSINNPAPYYNTADVLVPYQAGGQSFIYEVMDMGFTRMVQ